MTVRGPHQEAMLPGILCAECGGEITSRWATAKTRFCSKACANRNTARNRATTTGRIRTAKGYIMLRMPGHPMADREGYVMEHRLVMAKKIGRVLTAQDVVHHDNGVKDDNRPENLILLPKAQHDSLPKTARPIVCPWCGHDVPRTAKERSRVADAVRRGLEQA